MSTTKFTLKNLAERCKPDKFYRLDIITEVVWDGDDYDEKMPFRTYLVNFSLYSDEYLTLEKIKSIPANDIFKRQSS